MKKVLISLITLTFVLVYSSCNKEQNALTNEELAELYVMESTTKSAKLYSDSLIWCCDSSLTCNLSSKYYYDSMYHISDNNFNINCSMYLNSINEHKHHSHMDDGMMNHSDQDSHVDEMNQMMKEIEKSHINYHPN